ncbi:MAG: beta-phosphoglucomutase [Flavobacteriaceae bacterium]
MNKLGVIFDLDGVIVDTAKYHFIAWRETARKLGFDFTEQHNEQLKGVSRVKSLELILKLADKNITESDKEKFLVEKNDHYLSLISEMGKEEILPGMAEFLAYLRDKEIPFSLGSASKNAKLILKSLDLLDLFDAIVDGNDVSKAKPDPEVFLIAADKIKVAPEHCVVIEDAIAGVEAANTAGMMSIGIGEKEHLSHADYVLSSTSELTPVFFEEITKK